MESASDDKTLVVVRFSAPSSFGTMMPSSLIPHFPNRFLNSEMRAVNSATVCLYGCTCSLARSYKYVRITASWPDSTPNSPAKSWARIQNLMSKAVSDVCLPTRNITRKTKIDYRIYVWSYSLWIIAYEKWVRAYVRYESHVGEHITRYHVTEAVMVGVEGRDKGISKCWINQFCKVTST